MFFVVSKIFWSLIQPLNALCFMAMLGVLIRLREKWGHAGQALMNFSLCAILIFGVLPIGPLLMIYLERQYPTPQSLPAKIDGIIVLGGAFESAAGAKSGQIVANDQIDRMFCFVDLAKKYPEAKLVFSGGPGDILNPSAMEGNDARRFFDLTGIDKSKIIFEEKSRNTFENIVHTMEMTNPKASQTWVVTTSAYHMPRTMGIFAAFRWPVIPYQCDMRTNGDYKTVFKSLPSVTGNFSKLNYALKELIGNAIYYFTDKSAYLIPSRPRNTK